MESWRLTASAALSKIYDRSLTIEDYARSILARIDERDDHTRVWVHLDRALVLQRARELDAVPHDRRGPIHGLPVGVKDIILTKDMPTQYNSRLLQSDQPIDIDAAPVAVLRQSGALIFGKLTTTEFATSKQGDWHQNHTRNAHSEERTPGGSSSGSGAAVADFQIPLAIGTQTGGSIIRPASFNGCFGWKPTWNIISREGLAQWCVTFDTCGFFARSIVDLELMADVFRLPKEAMLNFEIRGAKVVLCRTHNWPNAGEGTREAFDAARSILLEHGAVVQDLELPAIFSQALKWHEVIRITEGRSSFLGQYLTDAELLHDDIRGYVKADISSKDVLSAYDGFAALRPQWDSIAAEYDAILTPSVPDEAPLGLENTGDMSFCSMWTGLHVPCLNIPFYHGANDMPIGLTLVGARMTDRSLLSKGKIIAGLLQSSWQTTQ